jgi:predicted MPP superfamily phosphohydrolase
MLAKQIFIISLILPFIEYYCFVAVRKALQDSKTGTKIFMWIFYALLTASVYWALFSFRTWATTTWPSHFLRIFVGTLLGFFFGKLLTAFFMFGGDILVLIRWLFQLVFTLPERMRTNRKPAGLKPITRSEFIAKTALIAGGAFTGLLGFGMTNKYRYKIRRVQVPVIGLPDELKGLKIVQISDIHSGSLDNRNAVLEGIRMIMDEKPDLILFTGDLVNYRADEMKNYAPVFGKLHAPLGVYSILGNHDYGDYLSWSESERSMDFERLKNYHKMLGWRLMLNENIILRHRNTEFALIGVENWSARARFPKYGKLDVAMAGLKDTKLPLKILMSHDPSHWDAQVRPEYPDINLTLSGHTHGMQMGIELPGFKWSPVKYLYKQWAGLYHEDSQYLYVNRGFGFIGYDGRLGILPEITVLNIG